MNVRRLTIACAAVALALVATVCLEASMAERRVTVPVRFSLEPNTVALYGAPTLSGTDVQRAVGLYGSDAPVRHFMTRGRIGWDQAGQGYGVYASGVGPTITFPQRAPAGLRAIDAVRVMTAEDDAAVSVLWRAVLGEDATEYYWNGAAWVAAVDADSHWTTSSSFEANLGSVNLSLARQGFGLRCSLRSTVADVTPYVYGVEMLWAVRYVTTSGNPLRHEEPREEMRIAVAAGLKALTMSSSEEFTTDGSADINYSGGAGDYALDVSGIDAVYDVTDDPELDSPLPGSWDAGNRRYTLDSSPAAGHVLHVDLRYVPLVSLGGDKDLFVDSLPLIAIGQPRVEESRQRGTTLLMMDDDGATGHAVRSPAYEMVRLDVRVVGRVDSDVRAIVDQVREWLTTGTTGPNTGVVLTLPTAATAIELRWLGTTGDVSRRGDAYQQVFQLGVFGVPIFLGTASVGALVDEVDGAPEAPIPV